MAQKITLVDDIDGSQNNVSTIQFVYGGTPYEIDLSEKNAAAMADALRPYIENARVVSAKATKRTAGSSREDLSAIRKWGRANGFRVSERGRVSSDVIQAYENRAGVSA